jgi:hypothetical protein
VSQDIQKFVMDMAVELRKMAEESGTDCDAPGCNALTLGVRCSNCSRRLCNSHAFYNVSGGKLTMYCPFCVVALNPQCFSGDDDDDDDDMDGG